MFSDNLLYLRNIKGLSQEQVAEAVGISRQSYTFDYQTALKYNYDRKSKEVLICEVRSIT